MRRVHDSDGATAGQVQRLVAPPTAAPPGAAAIRLDRAGITALQQAAGNTAAAAFVEAHAIQRIEAGQESEEFRPTPIGGEEESE